VSWKSRIVLSGWIIWVLKVDWQNGSGVVNSRVVGSRVVGSRVVGSRVVGSRVVGSRVVGSRVVGSTVVGSTVVGSTVVGFLIYPGTRAIWTVWTNYHHPVVDSWAVFTVVS